jgi:predicted dinucleotide-binding enzyme
MTIGIIGAGNIGQAIAKHLASAGLPASIANNRGPGSLSSIVQKLGAGITAAEMKTAAKADIVFLAVPWTAYEDAVAGLSPWGGRIVIDAMNAASISPEGLRPFDLGGRASSQIVAERLTGARVVKGSTRCRPPRLRATPTQTAASGCCLSREMTRRHGRKSRASSIGSDSWPSTSETSKWAADSSNSLAVRSQGSTWCSSHEQYGATNRRLGVEQTLS